MYLSFPLTCYLLAPSSKTDVVLSSSSPVVVFFRMFKKERGLTMVKCMMIYTCLRGTRHFGQAFFLLRKQECQTRNNLGVKAVGASTLLCFTKVVCFPELSSPLCLVMPVNEKHTRNPILVHFFYFLREVKYFGVFVKGQK